MKANICAKFSYLLIERQHKEFDRNRGPIDSGLRSVILTMLELTSYPKMCNEHLDSTPPQCLS